MSGHIGSVLDAIAAAVEALAPTTPQPGPVVLFTSAAEVTATDNVACHLTNVGTTAITNLDRGS